MYHSLWSSSYFSFLHDFSGVLQNRIVQNAMIHFGTRVAAFETRFQRGYIATTLYSFFLSFLHTAPYRNRQYLSPPKFS